MRNIISALAKQDPKMRLIIFDDPESSHRLSKIPADITTLYNKRIRSYFSSDQGFIHGDDGTLTYHVQFKVLVVPQFHPVKKRRTYHKQPYWDTCQQHGHALYPVFPLQKPTIKIAMIGQIYRIFKPKPLEKEIRWLASKLAGKIILAKPTNKMKMKDIMAKLDEHHSEGIEIKLVQVSEPDSKGKLHSAPVGMVYVSEKSMEYYKAVINHLYQKQQDEIKQQAVHEFWTNGFTSFHYQLQVARLWPMHTQSL